MPLPRTLVTAQIPVPLEVPERMLSAVVEVMTGEYEPGYFGEGLTILDIGANAGSFSRWAHLRWPGSTIHAFEPHPGTCAILRRNVSGLDNITVNNVAVYPGEKQQTFFARYEGDGEAGLAEYMTRTFAKLPSELTFQVAVRHPRDLPPAHLVKIDVEGAESEILKHLDLSTVELVLLEYQDEANQRAIKDQLAGRFVLDFEDALPWDALLGHSGYRPDLAGNHYGRMFFVSRELHRLQKLGPPRPGFPAPPPPTPVLTPAPPLELRYRIADGINEAIKRTPLVHRLLRAAAARLGE